MTRDADTALTLLWHYKRTVIFGALAIALLINAAASTASLASGLPWLLLVATVAVTAMRPDLSPVAEFVGFPEAGSRTLALLRLPGSDIPFHWSGARLARHMNGDSSLSWPTRSCGLTSGEVDKAAYLAHAHLGAVAHEVAVSRQRWAVRFFREAPADPLALRVHMNPEEL